MATKKHLSSTEWWLIIGALLTVDLTMIVLDFFAIGFFIDPFIDSFIAMAFPFYMHIRGQDMTNSKRVAAAIITWLTAILSDGILDFWWADGLYYMYLDKAEAEMEKLEAKVPGGKMIGKIGENKIAEQKRRHDEMMKKFPSKNTTGSKNPRWLNDNTYTPKSASINGHQPNQKPLSDFNEQKEEFGAQYRNESQELKIRRNLKENELIVADSDVGRAKRILGENQIPHKDTEYTKRKIVDVKTDTTVPGEFVLAIFDPEHPDRPATFDFVKQVFGLIKDSSIPVRYGKNPERG